MLLVQTLFYCERMEKVYINNQNICFLQKEYPIPAYHLTIFYNLKNPTFSQQIAFIYKGKIMWLRRLNPERLKLLYTRTRFILL